MGAKRVSTTVPTIDRVTLARAIHEYNFENGIDCNHENSEPWSWDCVSEAEEKVDIYERLEAQATLGIAPGSRQRTIVAEH